MDFLVNLGIATAIGLFFYVGLFVLHYINTKNEPGETTRKHGRTSLHAPSADAYDSGQTARDGQIVLAQYYRRYGTEAQKQQAASDLRRLGLAS